MVYGVRSSRATDTVFKRSTAQGFYKLMNWLMGRPRSSITMPTSG